MKIYSALTDLIAHTPLLEASRLVEELQLNVRLLLKLESWNPGGSAKDRVALAMIEDAERRGVLKQGGVIIEPTSGNTGIGLAWIAAVKHYRLILTMPETMSIERRKLLNVLGAEIVLTPAQEGMSGAVKRAEELKLSIPDSVILQQFQNPVCPAIHEQTTGVEIFNDTEGRVDVLVAGVGTGGTLIGTARVLKRNIPHVHVVAVEPQKSPVLSGGTADAHGIQGIGAGFVSPNYDASLVDEVIQVTDEDAFSTMQQLIKTEGVFAGISSGAAVSAALQIAQRPQFQGASIVVVLPDTGDRYLSLF